MDDVAPTVAVIVVLGAPLLVAARVAGRLAPLVVAALALQIVAALAHVAIVRGYYGYGDMMSYWRGGMALDSAVDSGRTDVTEVFRLVLQLPTNLTVLGAGRSTGSMHGISAFLCSVLDDSLVAICVLVALVGFAARLVLWSTVRRFWPREERALLIATLWIPSTVFWSAGLLKEAVALPGLCVCAAGAIDIVMRRRVGVVSAVFIFVGVPFVALTKAYLLFPLLVSVAVAIVVRSRVQWTFAAVPAAVVAVVGLLVLGQLFPRYALENVVDSAEDIRRAGETHAGGASFQTPGAALVPVGVATALFRPLIVESSNPLLAFSALEMTVFTVLLLRGARHGRAVVEFARRNALFAMCLTFVGVFSIALGISTTNLGTLARYRAPMMPFYAMALVGMSAVARRRREPALRSRSVWSSLNGRRPATAAKSALSRPVATPLGGHR